MAGTGRTVNFHGAFKSKARAAKKERQRGGFLKPVTIKGHRRWLVMTDRGKRPPSAGRSRSRSRGLNILL
jgi:hypothetical protein